MFFSFKSIKLAKNTSHQDLLSKYQTIEDDMKMLLYAGSIKELKARRKEYKTYKLAMLYQYTPQYTNYINRLQRR